MGKKTIERKFKKRFFGEFQTITNHEDFSKQKVGDFLSIQLKGEEGSIGAYFEGVEEITLDRQRVFLQFDSDNKDKTINYKSEVVKCFFPLIGEISRKDFYDGQVKSYPLTG